jgi:hypothetical protein
LFQNACEDAVSAKYWHTNIEEPAMMIISGARGVAGFLDGDANICESGSAHLATYGLPNVALGSESGGKARAGSSTDNRPQPNHPPPKKQRVEKVRNNGGDPRQQPGPSKDAKMGPDGRYLSNRYGNMLCVAFNNGTCNDTKRGNPICSKDPSVRHNCSICLNGSHGAHECKGASKNDKRATFAKKK